MTKKAKRNISKPRLAWLGFNGLVLLWFVIRLRFRLVFWYDKWYLTAIVVGVSLIIFFGWCILGLFWLFQRSKVLGIIASILSVAAAGFCVIVLLPSMVLGLGMAASAEWRTEYFDSPEGTNTLVVFWGGDAGATTRGPYYAAYPMICKGVYRYSKDNETERTDSLEYVPPDVEWLSEREARVRCGGREIGIKFQRFATMQRRMAMRLPRE